MQFYILILFWNIVHQVTILLQILPKNVIFLVKSIETRPSMIGSPERVKIQRSLVQNLSKIQLCLNHRVFLNILGVKIPPGGHNKFWGSNNIKNEFTVTVTERKREEAATKLVL